MVFTEEMIYVEGSNDANLIPIAVKDIIRIVQASLPSTGLIVYYRLPGSDDVDIATDTKTGFRDAWSTALQMYGSNRVRKDQDRIDFSGGGNS